MQSVVAAGAVLAAIISSVAADPAPSAAGPAGVVQFDVHQVRSSKSPGLRRRDTPVVEETLMNNFSYGGYFMTAQIGTPAQTVTVLLDTGSSDFWVPDSESSACETTRRNKGCTLGSFDPSESSTYNVVNADGFEISYVDGSKSSGDYFTDTVSIGGMTLDSLTMGLGSETTVSFGIAGIAFAADEAIDEVEGENSTFTGYSNLPLALKQAGLIKSTAYSLWLNDLDASTGNILFGGVDTEKYTGHLTTVNMLDDITGQVTDFRVPLTSVIATSSTGLDKLQSADYPINAILDSGTTIAYFPQSLAEQLWEEAGAYYEASVGKAVLPCSRASSGGTFTFVFGGDDGAQITVPMNELVLDSLASGAYFTDGEYKGQDACVFGFQNQSEPTVGEDYYILLGDTFLRSAYVVYDLENKQIGLAQTDFNATDTKITAFASAGASIPDGTPAPSQTSLASATGTVATPTTYNAAAGFSLTATGTVTAGASTSTSHPKNAAGTTVVSTGLLHTCVLSAIMFVAGGMLVL